MSDKKVTGGWLDLPLEELDKRMPKETGRMKREKGMNKFKKVLDFLGIINLSASKGVAPRGKSKDVHVIHNQPTSPSFRQSVQFDPERAYIQRMQEMAYHQMVDGKGDHECDHEH